MEGKVIAYGRALAAILSIASTLASGRSANAQVDEPEEMPLEAPPPQEVPIDEDEEESRHRVVEYLEEHVAVHGFGYWAGGITNENQYVFGSDDVDFSNVAFSPRILATFGPSLKMASGFTIFVHEGDVELQLDFAFAEWRPFDQFALLVGRTIFPHGYYTPIFDVATLRPFGALPSSVYGAAGGVAEGLNGFMLEYQTQNAGGFNVRVTGWVGQLTLFEEHTPFQIYEALALPPPDRVEHLLEGEEHGGENVRVAGGAVIRLLFPIPGLELELGAYAGQILEHPDDPTLPDNREPHIAALGGISYVGNALELHAEYVFHAEGDHLRSHGAYLEGAYRLTENWQVAARGEIFATELEGVDEDALAPSFDEHR
ncbi:MAG: hypothetical protein H5U40_05895, partial [Polyangiaceae bacterium]|nr:hypothetical protein [Polyangiaceae bacterium]